MRTPIMLQHLQIEHIKYFNIYGNINNNNNFSSCQLRADSFQLQITKLMLGNERHFGNCVLVLKLVKWLNHVGWLHGNSFLQIFISILCFLTDSVDQNTSLFLYVKCRSWNGYFWNVLSTLSLPADGNRLPACLNTSNRDVIFNFCRPDILTCQRQTA